MKKYKKSVLAETTITASETIEIRNSDSGEYEEYTFTENSDGIAFIDKVDGDSNSAYGIFDPNEDGWVISKGYEHVEPIDTGFYELYDYEQVAEYCSVADYAGSLYRSW